MSLSHDGDYAMAQAINPTLTLTLTLTHTSTHCLNTIGQVMLLCEDDRGPAARDPRDIDTNVII